jgi:hypothetical protein
MILLSCSIGANAQLVLYKSVVADGSASYTSPGLSVDWTVGQTVVNQYTSTGLTITEGFHPVLADPTSNAVPVVSSNIRSVNAFPNPTSNVLNIDIVQSQPKAVTIQVSEITGKVVKNIMQLAAQQSVKTEIDMSSLSAGTYIIVVNAHTADAYTMKVVKR